MEKTFIEEIHSIVVSPFYGDDAGWREIAAEVIASSARVSVIPVEKMDSKVRDISAFMPENRLDLLGSLGKSLQADAVLHGVILNKEQSHELILQLISSRDARILWWQAVDIRYRASSPSASDQKALLSKMLDPLISLMGKREKPVLPAETTQEPKKEENPAADSLQQREQSKDDEQQNSPTKPKADKKLKKTPKPTPPEEEFNPM